MHHSNALNEKDFLKAYNTHADAIFRHCYFRVFDRDKSKSLMCESFKRLWLFIADGNYVDSVQMFLYRAADALIRDAGVEETVSSTEHTTDVEGRMVSVLRQLPHAQRRTAILHFIDGFSPQEISDIIGGSVRSHALALEKQRAMLSPLLSSLTTHAA